MLACLMSLILQAAPPAPPPETSVYFSAESSGVGDPNPYYENGVYSVFFLKNEGRHPWWMTQSRDLRAWTPPSEAVPVGAQRSADSWTGSGSVIADPAGGYRIYYTGHSPRTEPREVVMASTAPALTGPWKKDDWITLAGPPYYDAFDFRDPFVFWNEQKREYWMLLTSRRQGRAAIARYASTDLANWTAQPPLYAESSPLNLEVPDLFTEAGDWFLLFSDQRDQSRQVRYLSADSSDGAYAYGAYDALDGRAFYAGKSAGSGDARRMFGWIAAKSGRSDRGELVWGGDLVVHALRRSGRHALAVDIPDEIARTFQRPRATLSMESLGIGPADQPLRVTADIGVVPGSRFGVNFASTTSTEESRLEIDTTKGQATFLYAGNTRGAPNVPIPLPPDGQYHLDLIVDPELGLGILYINHFRALSFRFYGVRETQLTLFADNGFLSVVGAVNGQEGQRQIGG